MLSLSPDSAPLLPLRSLIPLPHHHKPPHHTSPTPCCLPSPLLDARASTLLRASLLPSLLCPAASEGSAATGTGASHLIAPCSPYSHQLLDHGCALVVALFAALHLAARHSWRRFAKARPQELSTLAIGRLEAVVEHVREEMLPHVDCLYEEYVAQSVDCLQ
jgi:hypothetical protein